ncbi:hypothetical protein K2X14_07835 [Acetobacter sp. TBRC 12305]|nr:hypothetical protein [Acetobacter garciniae]MBX0344743.1 hypothetical protein [Acetobacter garciniae]
MTGKSDALTALDEQYRQVQAEIMAADDDAAFSVVSGVGILPPGGWQMDTFGLVHGQLEHNLTAGACIAMTALKEAPPHTVTQYVGAFAQALLLGAGLETPSSPQGSAGGVPCAQTRH